MTLEQFQSNPQFVSEWKRLTTNPIFQVGMTVLRTEDPLHRPDLRVGMPPSDDSKMLGRIQGYQFCINNIEALGVLQTPQHEPEAVFESEKLANDKKL